MTELWILRHAKAAAAGPDGDRSRPLTSRGRRQAHAVADHLEGLRASGAAVPVTVLSSSAIRAAQTAEIVCSGLGTETRLVTDTSLYAAEAHDIVALLRVLDDDGPVMVVGHNPTLHDLALGLLGPDDILGAGRLDAGLATAALAVVDLGDVAWAQLDFGQGTLRDLYVAPR